MPQKNRPRRETANEGARLDRKRRVAALKARHLTVREIVKQLEVSGALNPATGRPWSRTEVQRDIEELREQWRAEARKDMGEHLADQMAELDELRRQGWAEKDLALVLRALERQAKLLGLDGATRVELTGVFEVMSSSEIEARLKALLK